MPAADSTAREERILDAAAALIAHYGYDKTTVSDIAREAGVSKGAVYLHWESKDGLFDALLVREMKRLMADLQARIETDPEGGTIPGVYRHSLLALMASPFMKALYMRDIRLLGDWVRREDRALRSQRFLFNRQYVRRMQDAGLLRGDLDAKVIAFVFSILSYGLLTINALIPAEESPPLEETISALSEVVRLGLVPQHGGDGEAGKQALEVYLAEVKGQFEATDATEVEASRGDIPQARH